MQVIITSKTHMLNSSCVGAIAANGRFLRLLDENGYNQSTDTNFEVRQLWDIEFTNRIDLTPPHVEDVLVHSKEFKGLIKDEISILEIIERFNTPIWRGSSDVLFDGKIQWTNSGSGYISEDGGIPSNSVGFWLSDKDLIRRDFNNKVRYSYPIKWRNISFVGFQHPVAVIPAKTLIRVSLARWWSPSYDEERCYLQLSGWYDLKPPNNAASIQSVNCNDPDDSLPF